VDEFKKDMRQRALRLVGGEGDGTTVEAEEVQEGDISILLAEITGGIDRTRPFERHDNNAFKIEWGLMGLYRLTDTNISPVQYVNEIMLADRTWGERESSEFRFGAIRAYEAFRVMKDALELHLSNPRDAERFVKEICPSEIWDDPELESRVVSLIARIGLVLSQQAAARGMKTPEYIEELKQQIVNQIIGIVPGDLILRSAWKDFYNSPF